MLTSSAPEKLDKKNRELKEVEAEELEQRGEIDTSWMEGLDEQEADF